MLAGAYGLTHWLELSAQVPVLLRQQGDDLTESGIGRPAKGLALGTPYVGLRLGILSQGDDNEGLDLALGVSAGLPVGSAEALARESSLSAKPSIMVGRSFGMLRAAVDAGVALKPSTTLTNDDSGLTFETGNELHLGAALSTTGEVLRGELNIIAQTPLRSGSSYGTSIEALAGARLQLSDSIEVYALAGVGFGVGISLLGTPTFRGLLGMAFGSMQ